MKDLRLHRNNLTGGIPAELGDLANLQWLSLDDNYLTGGIPPELGKLVSLKVLDLSSNYLTGEIPPELGDLASLERLALWFNNLTGEIPRWLGDLANLERLALSDNGLTGGIPAELGKLVSLKVLDLSSNNLTGEIPPELGDLASLRWLRLGNWFFRGNRLTGGIPPELGDLASLERLYLPSNRLTGEIPPELGKLASLERLALHDNGLSGDVPSELGNLAGLELLFLFTNGLTGELPAELSNLGNLNQLNWRGNSGLCAPGTRQFIDFAAGIERADGPFCHETDAAVLESLYGSTGGASWRSSDGWLQPGPLSDWHGVETDPVSGRVVRLDVSRNGLSGVMPVSFGSLDVLRELRVDGNGGLGGRLPLSMTRLALRTLRYDGTSLCAPAAPSFRSWLSSLASYTGNGEECAPLTDRDVLEALYHSAGGPDWDYSWGWLETHEPLDDWHGVETDASGRVTGLSLYDNGLTGEIPPELGDLANLEVLELTGNGLTGEIPPELGDLASLWWLGLSGNDLTGEIPPELGDLDLEGLYLDNNDLTGEIPPELGDLANLEQLYLYRNDLTGEIPPELGDLANLRHLYLFNNGLTGEIPPELGDLANLEHLYLFNNGLTGEIPPELGDLASLKALSLSNNNLTGEIPPELAPEPGDFTRLELLSLRHNNLTGEIPAELVRLAALKFLDLQHNNLTGEIPADLGYLDDLQGLYLTYNNLTGEIPVELGLLANLKSLWLGGNGFAGEIPRWLGDLAGLKRLALHDNYLAGDVPSELGDLADLELLILYQNGLTGELPAELSNLGNLNRLAWQRNSGLCAPGTRQFIDFAAGIDRADGPFCHETDAAVLESFYGSAGGASWRSSDGWLQPGPLSDWHGVETDPVSGRVVRLDVSRNGLSGVMPVSFGSLDVLRELRVDGNGGLGGRLPLSMTRLALRTLRYDGTSLCAPAAPSFRSWLSSLASYTGNGEECAPLTDRDVLEALYHSAGGPDWDYSWGWLETHEPLDDWHGVETDASGRVTGLSLYDNGLTGEIPPELGDLANLEVLELTGNGLTGEIPPELGDLASLWWLGLSGNDLTGEIPPELGDLDLEGLYLDNNDLTGEIPPELGDLANLEQLYLYRNDLTGEIPPELGDLANLRHLYLFNNGLTGEIPPELGDLANLEHLYLFNNGLTGEIPPELGDLANLEHLYLFNNGLTGEIPPELGDLANLWRLHLYGNDLTGEIPPELGDLANLEQLDLSGNDLTGEIPPELGDPAYLYVLDLSGNDLTGEIPPELGDLANLGKFGLSNNPGMSGPLPSALTALEKLGEFLLSGTGLCVRRDDVAVQSWLRSIPRRRVGMCAEQAGGSAAASAYVVQAVQSSAFPVPLVAGRPGLLRVFASASGAGGTRMPSARATFYQRDGSSRTMEVPSGNGALPAELEEGSLGTSANVEVPGDVLRPGVELVVEVDPGDALAAGLGVPRRIPATGRTALEVYELPSFEVTVVPFLWEAEPDSSILDVTRGLTVEDPLFEETRRLLPVGPMSVTVHDPVWTSSNNIFALMRETELIRQMEESWFGGGYWVGIMRNTVPANLFGVAFDIPSRTNFTQLREPEATAETLAHEFGHNVNLRHAPCGPVDGPDPAYPYRAGNIGAWGWDRRSGKLVHPGRMDLMSYCSPAWVGDYGFANAFRWRMHDEAGVGAFAGPRTRVLLLWGGADADGKPFLNPAFVVDARPSAPERGGEWRVVGEAGDGRALFDRAFEMSETADGDGRASFVFSLPAQPEWADELARIVLTGPKGSAALDARGAPAAVLLLDGVTGRVRGILRDWPESGAAQADAGALPGPGIEVQVSRGVPPPEAWRR